MRASGEYRPFCFGKLPIAGDFVRGDAGAPELAELDGWIHEGMHQAWHVLGGDFEERFDALPPARFLWCAERRGIVLAGWWQASRDAVGRRYPFLLGVRLRGVTPEEHALLPVTLEEFFAESRRLIDGTWHGLNSAGAIAVVRRLECNYDPDDALQLFRSDLREAPVADAWEGLEEQDGGCPELLLRDVRRVATSAAPPRLGIRWRLRGEPADAAFWLSALQSFGGEPPRLFLWHSAADRAPGVARMAVTRLEPKLFPGMLFSDYGDESSCDIGLSHGDQKLVRAAEAEFGAAVDRHSLADLLAALHEMG